MKKKILIVGIGVVFIGATWITFFPNPVSAQYLNCKNDKGINISVAPGKYTFDNEFVLTIPASAGLDPSERYGVELTCPGLNENIDNLQIIGGQIRFTRPAGSCSTIHKGTHEISLKHGHDVKCKDTYNISATTCIFSYNTSPAKPGDAVNFTFGNAGDLSSFRAGLSGPGIGYRAISVTINNHNASGTIPAGLLNNEGWYTLVLEFEVGATTEKVCGGKIKVTSTPEPTIIPEEEFDPCAGDATGKCEDCLGDPLPDGGRENSAQKVWTALGCLPTDPADFVAWLLPAAISIGGGIAFLLMFGGGFQIMTSSGNPEKLNKGKETLTSAGVGLLFIIFAVLLLKIIGIDIFRLPGWQE